MSCFDQTYSFKNKELLTVTKTRTSFCTAVFLETLQNFKANGKVCLVLVVKENYNL